jgi:hypothetical protein
MKHGDRCRCTLGLCSSAVARLFCSREVCGHDKAREALAFCVVERPLEIVRALFAQLVEGWSDLLGKYLLGAPSLGGR